MEIDMTDDDDAYNDMIWRGLFTQAPSEQMTWTADTPVDASTWCTPLTTFPLIPVAATQTITIEAVTITTETTPFVSACTWCRGATAATAAWIASTAATFVTACVTIEPECTFLESVPIGADYVH